MIQPREISPFEFMEALKSGIRGELFISFDDSKYLLYYDNLCVFEIIPSQICQGYYLNQEGKYQSIEDIFSFVEHIRIRHPDVADWFLFNIKKFS